MVRNIESTDAAAQIVLPQQITMRTLPLLERQVDDAIGRQMALEMMCGAVQIIDSAGLNWLLTARARMEVAGLAVKLVDPSAIMADVLMVTRLEARFVIQNIAASGGARDA